MSELQKTHAMPLKSHGEPESLVYRADVLVLVLGRSKVLAEGTTARPWEAIHGHKSD